MHKVFGLVGGRLAIAVAAMFFCDWAHAQEPDAALLKRMEAEKAARRGCKIMICDAARNRKAEGPEITCDVVKTWTATELKERLLKGKFDWPWSHAQCTAKVTLDRKVLSQVLSGAGVEVKLAKHPIACSLDQKEGAEKYALSFAITPVVSFKDGKATRAVLNWSDIDGTAVAKAAVWSATALDNNLGMLEGVTVDVINTFFKDHCDEVKEELGK